MNHLGDEDCCVALNTVVGVRLVLWTHHTNRGPKTEGEVATVGSGSESGNNECPTPQLPEGYEDGIALVNVLQDRWDQVGLLWCNVVWAVCWKGGAPTTRVTND